jgi:transaldolase
MTDSLTDLTNAGVSIWLDDLSRDRLVTGTLAGLAARDHLVGVTTNPTIFAKAISGSDAYAPQIRDLAARGVGVGEALRAVADHGRVPADSIHGHYDEARQVLDRLRAVGIDLDEVMQGLEDSAVSKFDASWDQLGEQLAASLHGRPAQAQQQGS